MTEFDLQKLIEGAVLLIDKPAGWTSFDVVNKIRSTIRHRANIKKIKVGHAGTLDPFATGLLIICTGKKTKEIQSFVDFNKEYQSVFEFGKESDSYDVTGQFVNEFPVKSFNLDEIKSIIKQEFLGKINQIPPMFSAKKIDGQRLYKIARKGQEVKREPRLIQIDEYSILNYNHPELEVRIICSKGTYIRSLANDLGKSLNSIAYCKKLRRTAIGEYKIENAYKLANWLEVFEKTN